MQANNPFRSQLSTFFLVTLRNLGPRSWLIVIALSGLYLIPFFVFGANFVQQMTTYGALGAFPAAVALLVQGRRGIMLTVTGIQVSIAIVLCLHFGVIWPAVIIAYWLGSTIMGYLFGIVLGQFLNVIGRLRATHQELTMTHLALQEHHDALRDANDELQVMHEELRANNEALTHANARLEALATMDSLTGLLNHRAFVEAFDGEIARTRRAACSCALLFFDIDHFKALNDGYGHPAGDTVLQQLAAITQQTLRGIDVIGRWGGEEFIAVLPATDHADASAAAERLRLAVAAQLFPIGGGIHVTCSIGVAIFPADARERGDLVAAADQAMYTAKRRGRNQVCHSHDVVAQTQLLASVSNTSREDEALIGTAEALVALVAARDDYTGNHIQAVSTLTLQVALALGLTANEARMIALAGRLHDIGKVAIPDAILHKPGALSEDEWDLMRAHPSIGADIISHIPALRGITSIIRAHHEQWNGTGYPDGLTGENIPLGARIIAIIDAFDAMTTDRPYRQACTPAAALLELQRCAATQFDPAILQTFIQVLALHDQNALEAAA